MNYSINVPKPSACCRGCPQWLFPKNKHTHPPVCVSGNIRTSKNAKQTSTKENSKKTNEHKTNSPQKTHPKKSHDDQIRVSI